VKMRRYNKDTEEQILAAAQKIFREKGFHGAKTQEIADEAGINKALLHYYFGNKALLFEKVFLTSLGDVLAVLGTNLNSDEPLLDKIPKLVESYIDFISENVNLFVFVISEIRQNKEFTDNLIKIPLGKVDFQKFFTQFKQEVAKGNINDIHPAHFLLNLVSLCIFPFLGLPIISNMFGAIKIDNSDFKAMRKEQVTKATINMLKKQEK